MRYEVMQSDVALTWSLGDGPLLGVEHRHVDRLFRRPEQLHKTHAHIQYNTKKRDINTRKTQHTKRHPKKHKTTKKKVKTPIWSNSQADAVVNPSR